jgi:DNA primase
VEEEFQVKVLTLESGFDPDLYIRRKGKEAYAVALKNSQKYFDYLIERARAQFPVRSAEGKVKAVNYLLPHIQRIPSRIARDELAREMAQKLGIDSSVLRQELKHAASIRSTATLKTRVEVQVTDAEKILIRALASATEVQMSEEHVSDRDGADEEFIPCRQAQFALTSEGLHVGLATESLIETLLRADVTTLHITELPLPEADRALLASVLMKDDEELTPERLDGAVRGLRRIQLRRKLERVQTELQTSRGQESSRMQALLQEKMRLKRALMDPSLADQGPTARPA